MHTLPPLAGCTGMQMRARVTSGGKSSAIFSFWRCWEEGTGSRGGGRAPRRGSRRAGRRRARARGPGGPRRRGERRRGTRRRRSGRPAVGTTPAQPRGDAPGPARPRPAESRRRPRPRPAPPRPQPAARGRLTNSEALSGRGVRGRSGARHPCASRGRRGGRRGRGRPRGVEGGRGEGAGEGGPRGARLPATWLPGTSPGSSLERPPSLALRVWWRRALAWGGFTSGGEGGGRQPRTPGLKADDGYVDADIKMLTSRLPLPTALTEALFAEFRLTWGFGTSERRPACWGGARLRPDRYFRCFL